jgi:hypothetical protein
MSPPTRCLEGAEGHVAQTIYGLAQSSAACPDNQRTERSASLVGDLPTKKKAAQLLGHLASHAKIQTAACSDNQRAERSASRLGNPPTEKKAAHLPGHLANQAKTQTVISFSKGLALFNEAAGMSPPRYF